MNASIKFVLRSDSSNSKEQTIMMRITQDRKHTYLTTKHKVLPGHWDEKAGKLKSHHPMYKGIMEDLTTTWSKIMRALNDGHSPKDAIKLLKIKRNDSSPTELIPLFPYLSAHIAHLRKTGKIKYAGNFETIQSQLKKFRDEQVTFQEINLKFIQEWEYHLTKNGVSPNSIHTYLRNLRTLCNNLIKERKISRDWYPFTDYSFSKFHKIETAKRAITYEEIQKFEAYHPKSYLEELAQNVFLFSFYCRGINLKDIALLTDDNIQQGRLIYCRSKTQKHYSMKLIAPAEAIIQRYQRERFGNKYLFPLLDSNAHTDEETMQFRINRMIRKLNQRIQTIGQKQGIQEHLTTYVARHSFATILYRKGISISVISEMLGHDTELTTKIYLKSFSNNELDDVIDQVL